MEKFLTISEAAKITGLSEYQIRQLDKAGLFPAVKTDGGHRRWKQEDVENLAKKHKDARLFYPDVRIEIIEPEKLLEGTDKFLTEEWRNRNLTADIVKESDWHFGSQTQNYCCPTYPNIVAYTHLYKKLFKNYNTIDFPMLEKINQPKQFKNLTVVGECGIVGHQDVHRWYCLPKKYVVKGAVWNYQNLTPAGTYLLIPQTIFIIVKNEAFLN